jgi:uncharacterized protein HemX
MHVSGKALLGWLLFALPEKTGELAKSINVQWLGAMALLGAMGLGAGSATWYFSQVKPEDLESLEGKMDTMLDRQDRVVEDIQTLRRSVCRLQGQDAQKCEERVREDQDRYEFELKFEAARDVMPRPTITLRSGP